jgi:hypothetical protein
MACINGVLHEARKTVTNRTNQTCSKCGKVHGIAWMVSAVLPVSPFSKEKARYCYDCTGNHWARALRLYRESVTPDD